MTIEKDLNIVLELLEASRASVCGLRQHRQHAWDRFENAAGEFFEDHGPALLSALADQRRLREAATGYVHVDWLSRTFCSAVIRSESLSPDNQRSWGQISEGQRVAIVPLDQEGE